MIDNLIVSVPVMVKPGEPSIRGNIYSEEVLDEAFNRCKNKLYLYFNDKLIGKVIGRNDDFIIVKCGSEYWRDILNKLIYQYGSKAGLYYWSDGNNMHREGEYIIIDHILNIDKYDMIFKDKNVIINI